MPVLFTNNAELEALKVFLNASTPETLVLRLYSNDHIPSKLDLTEDYIEVTAGTGYQEVTLTPANFTFSSGDPSSAAYPQIRFIFTGYTGPVYGYYVIGQTSGNLFFANRFTNAPIVITNSDDEIRITLTITLDNII